MQSHFICSSFWIKKPTTQNLNHNL